MFSYALFFKCGSEKSVRAMHNLPTPEKKELFAWPGPQKLVHKTRLEQKS
jgi:hypothetical protein